MIGERGQPRVMRSGAIQRPAGVGQQAADIVAGAGAGVRVSDQFTVFGSSGALVVAALTAVLPLALRAQKSAS